MCRKRDAKGPGVAGRYPGLAGSGGWGAKRGVMCVQNCELEHPVYAAIPRIRGIRGIRGIHLTESGTDPPQRARGQDDVSSTRQTPSNYVLLIFFDLIIHYLLFIMYYLLMY